ncbi:MAG TPA: phosphatase PAP2 family protein [Chloroflexia bacterium]|nr:phosphatase PAP2 family protein [Chloroflexia bacterium]
MDVERYTATLTPRQRRIFLVLDQYADSATALLALLSVVLQLAIGTPPAVLLATLALVCPAGLLTYALNRLCKWLLPKPRGNRRYHDLISPWLRGSFPSFHTQFAATFAATFCTAVLLLMPPETRQLAAALALASMGPSVALVAWSRLYLAVHDQVDVYGGLVLGMGVGAGVAAAAVRLGLVPGGVSAGLLIAGLVALVLAVSVWERRKRRARS